MDFKDPSFTVNDVNNLFALECMALCHNIISSDLNGRLEYKASSPDEMALVNFARERGILYKGIDLENIITIQN